MKTADGSYHYCYNGQGVVDSGHQVIVATELNNTAVDVQQLIPMVQNAQDTLKAMPGKWSADAGYCSAANLELVRDLEAGGATEFYISTRRMKQGRPVPESPRGRIPADATPTDRMARKLKTKKGKAVYARRKAIVEPVFGQINTRQGKHVLLRGLEKASGEWKLMAGCHNLLNTAGTGRGSKLQHPRRTGPGGFQVSCRENAPGPGLLSRKGDPAPEAVTAHTCGTVKPLPTHAPRPFSRTRRARKLGEAATMAPEGN